MVKMIIRQITGVLISVVSLMLILGLSMSTSNNEEMALKIFSSILLIFGLFLIFKYPRSSKQCKEVKNKKIDASRKIYGMHQAGLPIAQDSICEITYSGDKFEFKGSGNSFELMFEKITDICIKTDKEIQTQYVSSIGGAVAGAVVFGPLGAIVGGRAKKKNTTKISYYIIYTYMKEQEIAYISFEINNTFDVSKAYKWVSEFKQEHNIIKEAIIL
jgi:ABC-type nickel/cobalt efflux system permease component RcnA